MFVQVTFIFIAILNSQISITNSYGERINGQKVQLVRSVANYNLKIPIPIPNFARDLKVEADRINKNPPEFFIRMNVQDINQAIMYFDGVFYTRVKCSQYSENDKYSNRSNNMTFPNFPIESHTLFRWFMPKNIYISIDCNPLVSKNNGKIDGYSLLIYETVHYENKK